MCRISLFHTFSTYYPHVADHPIGDVCWISNWYHMYVDIKLFFTNVDNCQIPWATLSFSFCTMWMGIVWLVGSWRLNFSQSQRRLGYLYEYISPFYRSFYPPFSHTSRTMKILAYIYTRMIIIIMANYRMIFGPPYIWLYTWFSPYIWI